MNVYKFLTEARVVLYRLKTVFINKIYDGRVASWRPLKYTKQISNLVNWIVVDRAAGRACTGPRGVYELWRIGDDRLGLPRRLFSPDPSYERDG